MSSKNQAATAQGASTAKTTLEPKTSVNPFQKRLESYSALEKKVKQRKNLQIHFDQLEELEVTKSLNEFEEGEKASLECITLDVGNREYQIKNPTLIELVRKFLMETLTERMVTLESEIMSATI